MVSLCHSVPQGPRAAAADMCRVSRPHAALRLLRERPESALESGGEPLIHAPSSWGDSDAGVTWWP